MQAPQPIYVGVDPAFRKNGFWAAILDAEKRMTFKAFDLLTWHDWLRSDDAPAVCFLMVENSNLDNQTYKRHLTGTIGEKLRKSRNVGANQSVSELAYISALRRYGPRFAFEISPEAKGQKITDQRVFEGLMRQEGITFPPGEFDKKESAQDKRDAAKLAVIMRRKVKLERLLEINDPVVHYNPGDY